MDIEDLSVKNLEIIQKLRENIESVHKAKHSRWTKELGGLLAKNKSLIILLRKGQRELTEKIEVSKEDLSNNIEKTDNMLLKLQELKYEKECILNEISRIKKLDTQELECLGIPLYGEKTEILIKFEKELQARTYLKNQLNEKEKLLQESKSNLEVLQSKIKNLCEGIKTMVKAGEPLKGLVAVNDLTQ